MHRLLARQLRKLGLDAETPPDTAGWRVFVRHVERTYAEADQERYLLDRSLEVSSEEMRQLYQRQKRSNQARMHAIASALPDLLFLQDEEGRYLEVFTADPKQLFRPVEEVLGRTPAEIFPGPTAEGFLKVLREALVSDQLAVHEYSLSLVEGERCFEARMMPTALSEQGRRTVVTVIRDITERRQAETRSRMIDAMFAAATEGMVILNQERRVLAVNPAFERITGWAESEVMGQSSVFLDDEENFGVAQEVWTEVLAKGTWRGEITARRRDGGRCPLWLTLDAIAEPVGHTTRFLALLTDFSEVTRSREELEYLATHDVLTGLPNRALFLDRLTHALQLARRRGRFGALMFLDLDRFKMINDSLGHQVGDDLLCQVGNRLRAVSRETDSVSRLGGDEFTLVVEGLTHEDQAGLVARNIIDAFAEPFRLGGQTVEVSSSVGIVVFPREGEDVHQLIKFADMAMYSAKEAGRNRYCFYSEALAHKADYIFNTELQLRKALAEGEFFLEYQPQYRLTDGALIGLEALVRWRHPQRGCVSPKEFIPVAEDTGLIELIGQWIWDEVCRQLRDWDRLGLPEVRVAINLSRRELAQRDLTQRVSDVLARYALTGQRLEFEITESAILEHGDVVRDNLNRLHEMGAELAIDDFGTGHSSLVNLKQFPLDRLKIDRTFVRDVGSDSNDEAIIRATVALARSLGLRVIAEGVENEIQRAYLEQVGCQEVQGYLYDRPMSGAAITGILKGTPRA